MESFIYDPSLPISCIQTLKYRNKDAANDSFRVLVGTNDGELVLLEFQRKAESYLMDFNVKVVKRSILSKKAILEVEVDEEMKKIFALHDYCLSMYDLDTMELIARCNASKGCTKFTLNKNPSSNEVLVVQKKRISFYLYTENDFGYNGSLSLPQSDPIRVSWIDNIIAVQYKMVDIKINYQTGESEESLSQLKISWLLQDRYDYLAAIVNVFGIRDFDRGGIKWSDHHPKCVDICYPFVAGVSWVDGGVVEIYNLFDPSKPFSKEFDTLHKFPKGSFISGGENFIVVANKSALMLLVPKPTDIQIKQLIYRKKVDEAFKMFNKTFQGTHGEKLVKQKDYEKRAAGVYFKNRKFKMALQLFQSAKTDPREILRYFPRLSRPSSNYSPPDDEYKPNLENIRQIIETKSDIDDNQTELRIKGAKKYLLTYLEQERNISEKLDGEKLEIEQDIEYALCSLYLNNNQTEDVKTLLLYHNSLSLEDVEFLFQQNENQQKYKSYFLWSLQKYDDSMQLLLNEDKKSGECTPIMIDLLLLCEDAEFVFKYAEYVLDHDDNGMTIFDNPHRSCQFDVHEVLQFLIPFPNHINRRYLEYLVHELHHEDESIHTKLALNYVNAVQRLKCDVGIPVKLKIAAGGENGLLGTLRKKLLEFLESTKSHYNVRRVLLKLNETSLHEEKIVIYHRLHDHESVLKLLICSLGDYEWAERYALEVFEEMKQTQKTLLYNPLFLVLIDICCADEKHLKFALEIMKRHGHIIDPKRSLSLLPNNLPLSDLSKYLHVIIRGSFVNQNHQSIIQSIHQSNYLKQEALRTRVLNQKVAVYPDTQCSVCSKPITNHTVLAVFPDLTMCHFKCTPRRDAHFLPSNEVDLRLFPYRFPFEGDLSLNNFDNHSQDLFD